MTKAQMIKKLNKMASEDLENNYKEIMSMACDWNCYEHYEDEENQIFVADVDNGICIEYDYYFFD